MKQPSPEELTAEDAMRLAVMRSPSAWFESFGSIQEKGGGIRKCPDLEANYLQTLVSDVFEYCMEHEIPCRMIILKPRQKGCSTFSTAMLYRFLQNWPKRACIIGGAHFQGDNLFKMLKLYAAQDDFAKTKAKILDREGRFPNGSTAIQQTAANPHAGVSGTFEAVLATEVAKWSLEGVANAADILAGLLKCVPDKPGTLVVIESTAFGAAGDYFERYNGAITFDELQAGRRGTVKIFAPWYMFPDSVRDPALEGVRNEGDYSETERDLAKKHGLKMNQVAWMRWAIREECKGDFDIFCQDYPFDEETAFLKSGRGRFNMGQLRKMKEAARIHPVEFGNIEPQGESMVFRSCDSEQARVLRWEDKREGCRYLLSADTMTGASQTSGADPDSHSVLVWRAGHHEHGRGWVPPKLVTRLVHDWKLWERDKKYQCWWDIDVLEEQIYRLSKYYGNCMIVPEVNMDRGLIELLKLRGDANIYEREMFNRREQTTSKALGWQTDVRTREMAIETLARAIREWGRNEGDGVEIPCLITLAECEAFIVKESGRSEAASGAHDDNVLSAAIGLTCLNSATTYRGDVRRRTVPRDLMGLSDVKGRARSQYR